MLKISDAEYIGNYRVRCVFNDGSEGVADLHSVIFDDPRPVFEPLRDPTAFEQLSIEHGALCWLGGVDIAPEYVYYLAFRDDERFRRLFEEWGYIRSEVAA